MDKETSLIRRKQWAQIISECNNREAGITKKQWCQENGIPLRQLYYWQRSFRKEIANRMPAVQKTERSEASSFSGFADITSIIMNSASPQSPHSVTDDAAMPELVIQIADCRIFVGGSVLEQTLETVLRGIRRA